LEVWFRRRAAVAATVAGALAVAGIFVLQHDAHRLFRQLLRPGLPLVILSAVAGLGALLLLGSISPMWARVLAVIAVGSVVTGWGVAQYPFLLGTHLSISEAAAPNATLWSVVVIFAAAAVLVLPSLALLYSLQQRGQLEGT
jgi:cytochrome d ubiquinol oxidase subunit II